MTAVNDRVGASEKIDAAANMMSVPTKVPAWQQGYSRRLVVIDLLGVVLAVGLAQWLRFGELLGTTLTYRYMDYTLVTVTITVIWMMALSINHSRSPRVIGSGAEEYRRVLLATLAVFGGVAIISMLSGVSLTNEKSTTQKWRSISSHPCEGDPPSADIPFPRSTVVRCVSP